MTDHSPAEREFLTTAHRCAMEMMNNAIYIQKEINRVEFPPGMADSLTETCNVLVEAKFDVISDLHDLDAQATASSGVLMASRTFKRILARLDGAVILFHPIVTALGEAATSDGRYQLAYFLVAESAVNLLNAHAAIPRMDEGS